MENVGIRAAEEGDARGIAEVHVRDWQWAYRGQMPDKLLDSLSVDQRAEGWKRELADLRTAGSSSRVWIAERHGQVIGFVSSGPSRDEDAPPGTGEVYAIYVLPEVVGTGVGRRLFAQAVNELRRQGFFAATLWVLETNTRTRRFYELAGWRLDGGVKVDEFRGFQLREVRYRIDLRARGTLGRVGA